MEFRLVHTEVPFFHFEKLLVSRNGTDTDILEDAYTMNVQVFPDKERPEMFGVMFHTTLTHHQEFKLELRYLAWFEGPRPFQTEEIESPFALVNAPAIAFPFLRSFVSLLTLNSGFRPAILPTVNFLKMYEDSQATKTFE